MSGWLGQGGVLYSMFNLDEMRDVQEKARGESSEGAMELKPMPTPKGGQKIDEERSDSDGNDDNDDCDGFVMVSSIESALSTSHQDCGHRLGNFRNYPNFNTSEERMSKLTDVFYQVVADEVFRVEGPAPKQLTYVDLGCNEAHLTLRLWKEIQNRISSSSSSSSSSGVEGGSGGVAFRAVGIDIDEVLIERARLVVRCFML